MKLGRVKEGLRKLIILPPVPTLLIAVPAYGLVIYVLSHDRVNPAIAYGAYLLSAYGLVITITGAIRCVCFVRRGMGETPFVKKILEIPLVNRYLKEDRFRAEAALYQGFLINLFYAGVKMFSGIRYKSVWFVTLAVYYIFLAVMRFLLVHQVRKKDLAGDGRESEWRRYRLCGIILLFMNIALSGMVILVVHQNSGFEYPGMLIYIMAIYTFYATVMAVRNVIKFRKYGSPVLSAAKVINLTAALVSMLSLETAMLSQFGAADDPMFRQMMTASTGAGISVIVVGMAVFMIVRATKEIKQGKREREIAL